MRTFRLVVALAGVASVLPLVFMGLGELYAEELLEMIPFLVGVVLFTLLPFGLLMALAGQLSAVSRWCGLAACLVLEASAYYEALYPDQPDGQAGLIFLVMASYLAALVLVIWMIDLFVRAVARGSPR